MGDEACLPAGRESNLRPRSYESSLYIFKITCLPFSLVLELKDFKLSLSFYLIYSINQGKKI